MLADKQSDVRLSAAVGLGSFGADAKEAVPDLLSLARDRDARLRRTAGTGSPGSTRRWQYPLIPVGRGSGNAGPTIHCARRGRLLLAAPGRLTC